MLYRFLLAGSLFLVLPIAASCTKDPEVAKYEYLRSGNEYAGQKKFREAIVQYRNAIQQDPRFSEARLKLGNSYLQIGDIANAYSEYVRVADLTPKAVEAQIRVGEILLLVQEFDEAKARAEKVLEFAPQNIEAQIIRANALAGLKKVDQAVAEMEEAIRSAPDRTESYASLGAIQLLKGDPDRAEAAFTKAIDTNPKSIAARLALANFFWVRGRRSEAEAQLVQAAAIDPRDGLVNRALAFFHMWSNRAAEAEPYFKVVAEVVPSVGGRLTLADYYISQGRSEEARPILERIIQNDGDNDGAASLRLAALDLNSGDLSSAERLVAAVLSKHPSHPEALMIKAQMLVGGRKLNEALTAARAAAKGDARSAPVQLVLGKVHAARSEPQEAIAAFNEAIRLNPQMVAAEIELARTYLSTNRIDEAEQYARSATQRLPDSVAAHLLLARISLIKGNLQVAESSIKLLSTALPGSKAVQTEVGLFNLAKRDRVQARAAFERALLADPSYHDALAALTGMEVEDRRFDPALARLEAAVPHDSRDVRPLLLTSGVHGAAKNIAEQERVLRRAIEIDPDNLQAYSMLGAFYAMHGRIGNAIAEFQTLADKQPRSVHVQTVIAMLLEAQNRKADARSQYEKVLAIDPRAAVAANNLAWLYSETGGNLDVALQLAQTAKAQLHNAPEVDDTLGWIYYKKGLRSLAIASLRQAVEKDSANPTYHYHLGMAYVASGDQPRARTSLGKALSLQANSSVAAGAREALATLK